MQTHFSPAQLARSEIQKADEILRKCVHCGFCTATCPTFVLTGDERDSPRGRIWMMRDFLEQDSPADPRLQHHLDRCLTCLSCMTTCPSGVDYMHLVDIGRAELQKTQGSLGKGRPVMGRLMRWMLSVTIPVAPRFHLLLGLASLARPFSFLMPARIKSMLSILPSSRKPLDKVGATDEVYKTSDKALIKRVMLLQGCAQRAIDPEINASTIRLLNRLGIEVVVRAKAACCGALAHHIDAEDAARKTMRQTIDAWADELDTIDAIVVNTSGCGTQLKDYGNLLADDAQYAEIAGRISALACDISELLNDVQEWPAATPHPMRVTYHAACSLQHGQKVTEAPKRLLANAGFTVRTAAESHLCCGSAGVYNVLQPELSGQLKQRKEKALNATQPDVIAAGNLGCINQLAGANAPICHTVQLLDWAYGGPCPEQLSEHGLKSAS